MATQLERLLVRIEGDAAPLGAALKRADAETRTAASSLQRSLVGIDRGFATLRQTLAAFGIGFGLTQLVRMGRQALDAAGGLGELAEQLGISTTLLQELQFGAGQAGVSQQELESAIARFSRTVGEAADGNRTYIETFDALGVGILDSSGRLRSTEAVLRDVSEALAAIDDPARRAAVAADLFGRSGQSLLPILGQGAAGFDQLSQAAAEAGVVLSGEMIAAADVASDRLAALDQQVTKLIQTLAVKFAPALTELLGMAEEFVASDFGFDPEAAQRAAQAEADLLTLRAELAELEARRPDESWMTGWATDIQIDSFRARIASAEQKLAEAEAELAEQERAAAESAAARFLALGLEGEATNPPPKPPKPPGGGRRQEAKETREATSTLQEYLDQLGAEVALLGVAASERTAAEAIMRAQEAAARDYAEGLRDTILLTEHEAGAVEALVARKEEQARLNRLLEEMLPGQEQALQLIEAERALLGATNEERAVALARLRAENELLAIGVDLAEAKAQAYVATAESIARATAELDRQRAVMSDLEGAFDRAADRISGALTDPFIRGGEAAVDWGEIVLSVLADIERELFRLAVMVPLKNAIFGTDERDIFDLGEGLLGLIFGGGGSSYLDPIFGGLYHGGGVVGATPVAERVLPAPFWTHAPRLHDGGLMPGEHPAILRDGEGVFTPEQMAALGGAGGTVVNVINNTGEPATQQRRRDGDGREIIEIVIGQVVRDIDGNGRVGRAIQRRFGVINAPTVGR